MEEGRTRSRRRSRSGSGDAPGSSPDPVEKRQATVEFEEFIDVLGKLAIDPDTEEMTDVFREAGFEAAIVDTRFFGETHSGNSPHISSSVIQLQSAQGAAKALEWLNADYRKPCPRTCATDISEFDVDGIPGARGVHRSASAENIEAVGDEDAKPFDSYTVLFVNGPFVYTVELRGPPGSVSEEKAAEIANAFQERIVDVTPAGE